MSEKERVHFKIAIPVDLKQRLEHHAVEGRRSLSAEIIARLEASLEGKASNNAKDEFAEDMFNALIQAAKGDKEMLDTYLSLAKKTVNASKVPTKDDE